MQKHKYHFLLLLHSLDINSLFNQDTNNYDNDDDGNKCLFIHGDITPSIKDKYLSLDVFEGEQGVQMDEISFVTSLCLFRHQLLAAVVLVTSWRSEDIIASEI